MSRPPKQAEEENIETIYTEAPSYDPYRVSRMINEDRDVLPQLRASQARPACDYDSNINDAEAASPADAWYATAPPATAAANANNSKKGGGSKKKNLKPDLSRPMNTSASSQGRCGEDSEDGSEYSTSSSAIAIDGKKNNSKEEKKRLIVSNKGGNNNNDIEYGTYDDDAAGGNDSFLEKSFFAAMLFCVCHPCRFVVEWFGEMGATFAFSANRVRNLKKMDILLFLGFLIVLTGTQIMSVFGFNFWLHSFERGNATYTSIVVPSVIYAVVNLLMIPLFKYKQRPQESLFFWTDSWESVLMLVVIGVADSVAGMTSTYAVPHIPVIVQTSVSSCGAVFVYILHRFLYKKTALPFSFLLMVCFLFLFGAVACAVAPVYLSGKTETYLEGKWIGIFVIVVVSPALYNVVQGRFLGKYAGRQDVPADTAKFVVLTGDFWVQAVVSFAYFPLDFTPGFGPSPDAEDAWHQAKEALYCIQTCEWNWVYLFCYVVGFWCGRVLRTIMNMYSPTMGQFVMQLMGPIKAFAIVLFPALNLKGKDAHVNYNAGAFGALLLATIFYLLANEQHRMKLERRRAAKAAEEGAEANGAEDDGDDVEGAVHGKDPYSYNSEHDYAAIVGGYGGATTSGGAVTRGGVLGATPYL